MANSHKRDTNARPFRSRKPRAVTVAAPLAVMATVSAVSLGVLASDPVVNTVVASTATNDILVERADTPVTRSTSRIAALDTVIKIPNAMSKKAIRHGDQERRQARLDDRRAQHLGRARDQGRAAR